MKDETLLKLSIGLAVLGLVSLFFVYESIPIVYTPISDITGDMVGEDVYIGANISSIRESKGTIFIELDDGVKTITGVLFNGDSGKLSSGEMVVVRGKIDEYQNKVEIIIKEITSV